MGNANVRLHNETPPPPLRGERLMCARLCLSLVLARLPVTLSSGRSNEELPQSTVQYPYRWILQEQIQSCFPRVPKASLDQSVKFAGEYLQKYL